MAVEDDTKTHEQEHPTVPAKSQAKDQAAQQKGAGAKTEVLDQFEIQRRLFFGK